MDRWAKYRDNYINLSVTRNFNVRKLDKEEVAWRKDVGAGKTKPWVLYADHTSIDAFPDKQSALKVAENIVKGHYDVK